MWLFLDRKRQVSGTLSCWLWLEKRTASVQLKCQLIEAPFSDALDFSRSSASTLSVPPSSVAPPTHGRRGLQAPDSRAAGGKMHPV